MSHPKVCRYVTPQQDQGCYVIINKYDKRTTMRPELLYVTRCYLMLLDVTRCDLMLLDNLLDGQMLFHQEKM